MRGITVTRWRVFGAALVVASSFLLVGCESCEVYGPAWVQNGQVATYTLDLQPYSGLLTNATVHVIADIPEEWVPVDWTFAGTAVGVPVTGAGVWNQGDPEICSNGEPSSGYQRVWAASPQFAEIQDGRDGAVAKLNFRTGQDVGVHELTFYVDTAHDGGTACSGMTPLTIEVHQWENLKWEQILGPGSPHPPGLGGVLGNFQGRSEFEGMFYTAVHPEPWYASEIWRSADLIDWELVRGFEAREAAQHLFEYSGRLMMTAFRDYVSPQPDRWELLASDDGLTWTVIHQWEDGGNVRPWRVFVSEETLAMILVHGEHPYYQFSLVVSNDGASWTTVGGEYLDSYPSCGSFLGETLFLGGSVFDGVSGTWQPGIWSFDGHSLDPVDVGPMAVENKAVSSMTILDGRVFVGTESDLGAEVWSFDGVGDWQQAGDDYLGLPGPSWVEGLEASRGILFALVQWDGHDELWFAHSADFKWWRSNLRTDTMGGGAYRLSVTGNELMIQTLHALWRRVELFCDGFNTGDTRYWNIVTP